VKGCAAVRVPDERPFAPVPPVTNPPGFSHGPRQTDGEGRDRTELVAPSLSPTCDTRSVETKHIVALVCGAAAIGGLIGAGAILLADSNGDEALPPPTQVSPAETTPPPEITTTVAPATTTTLPPTPDDLAERLIYVEQVETWMARIEGVQSAIGPSSDLALYGAAISELDEIYADVQAYREAQPYDENENWFYDEDLACYTRPCEGEPGAAWIYNCALMGIVPDPMEAYAESASLLAWWDSALVGAPFDDGSVADEEYVLPLRLVAYEAEAACREATERFVEDTEQIAAIYNFEE
jgi:hypothetical protein